MSSSFDIAPEEHRGGRGFGLLEVLVALTVGAVLLVAAMSMLTSNLRVYREQEMMSRLQEDMRFTMDQLLYDLRMAGYVGCSHLPEMVQNVVKNTPEWANLTPTNTLQAVEGNSGTREWVPGNDSSYLGNILSNTDGVAVRYLQPVRVVINGAMSSATAPVPVDGINFELMENSLAAIADCRGADVFVVSDVTGSGALEHGTSVNERASFSISYGDRAEIYRYISRRYLVEQRSGEQPSLYRYEYNVDTADSDGDGDTTESIYYGAALVEGVENMQLAYLSEGGNAFEDANSVSDWSNVTAVRLVLLLRTLQEDFQLTEDSNTYTLLGGTSVRGYSVAAQNDHRRRRVFSTTVQLRNRSG